MQPFGGIPGRICQADTSGFGILQIDEANLPGSADERPWAAQAINRVLDAAKPPIRLRA
jgi:hypothetical protein